MKTRAEKEILLLKSLSKDLKNFQKSKLITNEIKVGLEISIEQIERYINGDLVDNSTIINSYL